MNGASPELRVIKVGGSLFARPGLGPELAAFLRTLPAGRLLLVAGGGPVADAVRQLDATHRLGEEISHWVAVRSLQTTALFLEQLLFRSGAPPCEIVDLWAFARADEGRFGALPHSWDVTTDSLAARVAEVEGAAELVLLKSVEIPPGTGWAEAARRGWVDPAFAAFAAVVGRWGRAVRAVDFPIWAGRNFARQTRSFLEKKNPPPGLWCRMEQPEQPPSFPRESSIGDLYEEHKEWAMTRLTRKFPWIDPEDVRGAFLDALIRAETDPGFPPSPPRTAGQQLYYWAKDRLRSEHRGAGRRKKREADHGDPVTRADPAALEGLEELIRREAAQAVRNVVAKTPEEAEILDLWAHGVVRPDEIARRLGCGDSPDKIREVKATLARFRKRMERLRDSLDPGDGDPDAKDRP